MAAQMHAVPKVIGSITLDRADWQNPALIRGDAAAEITGSKQQSGKNIAISGPAMAAGGCARPAGRARSTAGPDGSGPRQRPFGVGGTQAELRLAGSQTFNSGVVHLTYHPASGRGRSTETA